MVNWTRFSLYSDPMMTYLENETAKVASQHQPPFRPDEFQHFDALHYCGYRYVGPFFETLPSKPRLLDIGAGIGGPARYAAVNYDANVTAIDPLKRYNQLNQHINQLCGLDEQIHVVQADAARDELINLPGAEQQFDAIYALLSFLHIADKALLLANCYKLLKPNGKLYIEDWAIQDTTPFTPEEAQAAEQVGMASRLTKPEYVTQLQEAGFLVVEFDFRSKEWSHYVWDRGNALLAKEAALKEEYGEEWWQAWSSWGAHYALYAFHELDLSTEAIQQAYPYVASKMSESKITYFTQGQVRQKFGGAYITAEA